MLTEPNTLSPLHLTISYLQMTFHLQAFGLLAPTYSIEVQCGKACGWKWLQRQQPMLSNCSRRARTILAVDPLPNAFAKTTYKDYGLDLQLNFRQKEKICDMKRFLKLHIGVQRTKVNAVPPALYDLTIRMCIDKTDTSKDNNQLWMRQQNLLLLENIPCICTRFDEATLLAGGRARGE